MSPSIMSFTVFTVFESHLVSFVCNLQECGRCRETSWAELPGTLVIPWLTQSSAEGLPGKVRLPGSPLSVQSQACHTHSAFWGKRGRAVACTEGAKFSMSCEGPLPGDWTSGEHVAQDGQCRDGSAGPVRGAEAEPLSILTLPATLRIKKWRDSLMSTLNTLTLLTPNTKG